ncbi:hypothetical protein AMTRI_Chr05g64610 [Amborella trichopoda]
MGFLVFIMSNNPKILVIRCLTLIVESAIKRACPVSQILDSLQF